MSRSSEATLHRFPSFRRLVAKVNGRERSVVRLATFRDKYAVASPDIDCASRIPLCGARCCSFEVSLSAQDVLERPTYRFFPFRRLKTASRVQ